MKFIRAFEAPHSPQRHIPEEAQQLLTVLEADWRNMTGTEEAPGTGRFDPAKLDAALPYAFVLHRIAPGTLKTRVAGQKLHDLLRMDPRGMPFAAFFTDEARDTATRLAEAALDEPAIVGIPLIASRGLGRKALRAEALLLPMRDASGGLSRIMGAIVTGGAPGYRSFRFDIATDQPIRCEPLTLPFPDRRGWRSRRVAEARAADPMPALKTVETRPNGPALRLVIDNTM